ncbi:MAG: hypothetical protein QOK40_3282 [Miltoncostaeaceae bacterium]|nr:hypothetical protein [Miltoncostaeaceae bacterium]
MPSPVISSLVGCRSSSDGGTRALGLLELGMLALVVLVMTLMSATARSATAGPLTFTPVADSYVLSDLPTNNSGTRAQLRADSSPFVRAYMRFDVQGLSGPVSSAILRVYANAGHATGYAASAVTDTGWGETTIISDNAPAIAATPAGSSGGFSAGAWTQADVTPLVQGNGLVSLALTTTSLTAMGVASRESGANAPQLVIMTASASDTTPPAAPTAMSATAVGSTQVSLAWDPAADNVGVTGYRVFRGAAQVGTPTATSFTDIGLSPGTAYSYTVKAVDAAGNVGPASNALAVTSAAPSGDIQAPTAPATLRSTAVGSTEVSLAWQPANDNVGVTGYRVLRDAAQVGAPTATSFTDTGLSPSTAYRYTVKAIDAAGNLSPASNTLWKTTAPPPPDPQAPTPPANLRSTAVGPNRASLAWSPATDNVAVTGYRVFRGAAQVGTPTVTSFTDSSLSASTAYSFTVKAIDAAGNLSPASNALSLTTAPPPAADPVIAAAGDIACEPSNANLSGANISSCQQMAVSDLLVGAQLSAVLALGDNQYNCGGLQAFQQSFDPSWGRVKSIIRPAPGNHEYLTCDSTNPNASGYFSYFGAAASPATNGYYSYDTGAWHLIVLNSQCSAAGGCGPTSPQGTWLANDLATHNNICTLAYWHIPLFSSGGRTSGTVKPFWDQLHAAGVDVVLNGHDHSYERFAPQTPGAGADPARGIRAFVVGTGGANHTAFRTISANSEVRNDSTFGVLELTLHPGGYDWGFVAQQGAAFTDAGSASCH